MNIKRIFSSLLFALLLNSCADYQVQKKEKKYYTSSGFALIYDEELYKNKLINKKINNEKLIVMHSFLKINTPIQIINPDKLKTIETKVHKKANYPKIFNVVISKKIATDLDLDLNNPYVEIVEIKKNKTFIAKEANTFEEERNVAEKAPIEEITMDDLSSNSQNSDEKKSISKNFVLIINDFYYEDSAIQLQKKLMEKTKMTNISVKKINDKKYRLLVGPFKNFNTLKIAYISLNNLGFDQLNIYKN